MRLRIPFATLAAAAALCQGAALAASVQKTAVSGHPVKLYFTTAINPDCTSAGKMVARFSDGPAHGTATSSAANDFPFFLAANDRSRCNTKRVPGFAIQYQSAPGYVGPDAFTLTLISPAGNESTTYYQMTVK